MQEHKNQCAGCKASIPVSEIELCDVNSTTTVKVHEKDKTFLTCTKDRYVPTENQCEEICGEIVSSGTPGIKDGHACFNKKPCPIHSKKLVKYDGYQKWHYDDCHFISSDAGVCNCPRNLKPESYPLPTTDREVSLREKFYQFRYDHGDKNAPTTNHRIDADWWLNELHLAVEEAKKKTKNMFFSVEGSRAIKDEIASEAVKKERQQILKDISELRTIYPLDVFSEPPKGWQKELDEWAKTKGYRIDNVSAHFARWQEKVVRDDIAFLIRSREQ